MRFPQLPSAVAAFGLAALANAQSQFLVNELSFGHTGKVVERGADKLPNFALGGSPQAPELLTNRLVLTPQAPGNARGSIWANTPNAYTSWTADLDFRANGPERGTGNLNLWLARGGASEVQHDASIYTVGRFDGVALVIDQPMGTTGMIRGFLNDGSIEFKSHHSVDSLAFGHCPYPYRNRGAPTQIKMRQTQTTFRVEVDGQLCFETDKVALPGGYHFGITAATSENPDSFEIFKFVTMTDNLDSKSNAPPPPQQQQQQQPPAMQQQQPGGQEAKMSYGRAPPPNNAGGNQGSMPDVDPNTITNQQQQFADLHNRVTTTTHLLQALMKRLDEQEAANQRRHDEVQTMASTVKTLDTHIAEIRMAVSKLEVTSLKGDMGELKREISNVRSSTQSNVKDYELAMRRFLDENHGSMIHHVATTASGHGRLIFLVLAIQVALIGGYIYYERKKTMPKKYL